MGAITHLSRNNELPSYLPLPLKSNLMHHWRLPINWTRNKVACEGCGGKCSSSVYECVHVRMCTYI